MLAARFNNKSIKLRSDDIKYLLGYAFPGNVRELQNIIERAIITTTDDRIRFTIPDVVGRVPDPITLHDESNRDTTIRVRDYSELKELERENLILALRESGYKIYGSDGAARLLKVKPTTLVSRIKSMKIPMRP